MLNKGISTPIAIAVILVLVIVVGSFTWWQYSGIEGGSGLFKDEKVLEEYCQELMEEVNQKKETLDRTCSVDEDCKEVNLIHNIRAGGAYPVCVNKEEYIEDLINLQNLYHAECKEFLPDLWIDIQPFYGCKCRDGICREIEEDPTVNWQTYENEGYKFEIKYPEKEMPLDEGGPTYKPNVFYFGSDPYQYKVSLVVFDVSEKGEYPIPSRYTEESEITLGGERGIKYVYEWNAPSGYEYGVYYEAHMRREITIDVEHREMVYRFHLNHSLKDQAVFEIFDQMLSSFKFLD